MCGRAVEAKARSNCIHFAHRAANIFARDAVIISIRTRMAAFAPIDDSLFASAVAFAGDGGCWQACTQYRKSEHCKYEERSHFHSYP